MADAFLLYGMLVGLPQLTVVRYCTMDAFFVQRFVSVDVRVHKTAAEKEPYGQENNSDCNN